MPENQPDFHDAPRFSGLSELGKSPISLDEKRAMALVTRRLFGRRSAAPVRLGRYEVMERLGSGGSGVVYRAWDPILRRDAAVKVLRRHAEQGALDPSPPKRMLQESRQIAQLTHPNIVEVFAVGVDRDSGLGYVVMEFVRGQTLRAWLDEAERSTASILDAFVRSAHALQAAHRAGVLHRDFKPENVMRETGGRIRVLDFGGTGTPAYMPPEQLSGQAVDPRADVYAWSVSLLRALDGRAISGSLREALTRGMHPDPQRRHPSMSSVLDAVSARRARRWRAVAVGGGLAAVVALALSPSAEPPCIPPDPIGQRASTPPSLQEAAAGFITTWNETAATVCTLEDAAVRRSRRACLRRARARWDGSQTAISAAPETPHAPLILEGLHKPRLCLDVTGSTSNETLRDAFEQLRAEITASRELGTWPEVSEALIPRTHELRRAALALNAPDVEADSALYLGLFALWEIRLSDATRLFEDAYMMATRAEQPQTAFFAARYLVQTAGLLAGDRTAIDRWLARARTAARARTEPDAAGQLLMLEGRVASFLGEYERAITLFDEAELTFDSEAHPISWETLLSFRGDAKRAVGRLDESLEDHNRALDRLRDAQLMDTMEVGRTLNGLGITLRLLGRLDEAAEHLEQLVKIIERQQPDTPDLGAAQANLAQAYADLGRHEAALELFEHTRATFEKFGGPSHPGTSTARYAMAEQWLALGDLQRARQEAQAALRWNVPQPYAGAVRLLLAKLDLNLDEGRAEAARATLRALVEDPENLAEVVEEAAALLDPSGAGAQSPPPRPTAARPGL